jgi:hypothetical protein
VRQALDVAAQHALERRAAAEQVAQLDVARQRRVAVDLRRRQDELDRARRDPGLRQLAQHLGVVSTQQRSEARDERVRHAELRHARASPGVERGVRRGRRRRGVALEQHDAHARVLERERSREARDPGTYDDDPLWFHGAVPIRPAAALSLEPNATERSVIFV